MIETAIVANGCFWCTEAIFKRLKGVISVKSGYSGGNVDNPSYDQVSMGNTGHAEAIKIEFDPSIISYETILQVFWYTHDPTTLNQQGNDVGPEYRSAIFYMTDSQKESALNLKKELEEEKIYKDPIVTEIVPFKNFFEAENYHKDYYDKNRDYPYCRFIIDPKVKKLLDKYSNLVKEEYKTL